MCVCLTRDSCEVFNERDVERMGEFFVGLARIHIRHRCGIDDRCWDPLHHRVFQLGTIGYIDPCARHPIMIGNNVFGGEKV